MKKLTILTVLCSLLFSCQTKESDKDRIIRLVNEWQGKEILFPDNIVFTQNFTDTVDYQIPKTDYKVLVFVDSLGCTSCKLQLGQWKKFIAYTDSITDSTVPFLFFFHPKEKREIRYLLKRDAFDLPVCLDWDNKLDKLNQFPSDITFQTFLLNKENKVVVLGNPIHNLSVKELYLKQITGQKTPSTKTIRTTVQVEQATIDMGTFKPSEKKTATFNIKNTGNQPLVILDAATTCGCANPSFEKHPAQPGDILTVEVTMEPKEIGFFEETITVKCNTEQPLRLQITGRTI